MEGITLNFKINVNPFLEFFCFKKDRHVVAMDSVASLIQIQLYYNFLCIGTDPY